MSNDEQLIDMVITNREVHSSDVVVLTIVTADGQLLPNFDAGSHVDVHIDDTLVRQYSLAGDPGNNTHYRLGILNDQNSRGGSTDIFKRFQVGHQFKISRPRNHFPLNGNAEKSLLIAGGIGITPILSMAYALRQMGKPFEIHYCLRSPQKGAFKSELMSEFGDSVNFHYSKPEGKTSMRPESVLSPNSSGTHIYVCGPSGLLNWVLDQAKVLGYEENQFHCEYFNADVDVSGDAFEVICKRSEVTVSVEATQSIAAALRQAGIKVNVSCEEGVCGTCITDVLEGTPDHRDHFLTSEEKQDNDQIALCCSRSCSKNLILDI